MRTRPKRLLAPQPRSRRAGAAAGLLLGIVLACAGSGLPAPASPPELQWVPIRRFDLAATASGRTPSIAVHLAHPEEIPPGMLADFRDWLSEDETAHRVLVVATLLNPIVALSGIVYSPLIVGLAASELRARGRVAKALSEEGFPERLRGELERALSVGPEAAPDPRLRLEVDFLGFGLFSRPDALPNDLCLAFEGLVRLRDGDRLLYEDPLIVQAGRRSLDAPPPSCRSLEAFAADDGSALRADLAEASAVLAQVVTRRLGVTP